MEGLFVLSKEQQSHRRRDPGKRRVFSLVCVFSPGRHLYHRGEWLTCGRVASVVNMKYTLDWCVFGYPDNYNVALANKKCAKVCAGPDNSAKRSLADRLMQTNTTLQYLYCDGPDMNNILDRCAACLDTVPNAEALKNCKFSDTLQ